MTLSSGSDTASNVCSLRMTWKVWQPFATVWILMKVCGSTKCNSRPRLVSSGMMLSGYGDQALAVLSQPNLYMIHDEHNLWRNPPTPSRHRACEGPGTRSPAPKHPASSQQAQPASQPDSQTASQPARQPDSQPAQPAQPASQPAQPASQLGGKVSTRAAARHLGCSQVLKQYDTRSLKNIQNLKKSMKSQPGSQPGSQPAQPASSASQPASQPSQPAQPASQSASPASQPARKKGFYRGSSSPLRLLSGFEALWHQIFEKPSKSMKIHEEIDITCC